MSKPLQVGDVVFLPVGFRVYDKSREPRLRESGEFVVVRTHFGGGGTGMGPHDVYPDGWHVELRRLRDDGGYDQDGRTVSFYQSGCFTVMHADVPVVRRMRQTFVPEE